MKFMTKMVAQELNPFHSVLMHLTHLSDQGLDFFSRVGFEPTPLEFSELPFIRLVSLVTRFVTRQTTSGVGSPDPNPNPPILPLTPSMRMIHWIHCTTTNNGAFA